MALEKKVIIGVRTVLADGQIQVREDSVIVDTVTGVAVSDPKYRRYVVEPGDDLSKQPVEVKRLANVEWTPESIAAFRAEKQAALDRVRG